MGDDLANGRFVYDSEGGIAFPLPKKTNRGKGQSPVLSQPTVSCSKTQTKIGDLSWTSVP